MIDIFDISGTKISSSDVLSELLVTKDCQHIEELMKANYVKLSWEDTKRYELPVGAYIIPFPNETNPFIPNDTRYPIKYKLFSPYVPEAKNTADYEYEPEFQHPIMWLANLPLMFITGNITSWADALKKTTWGYTGSATQIASFIVNCINWIAAHDTAFGNTFGTGWVAMVDTNLAPNATVSFDSVDIMSGASAIAQAFDCEFHFDFARKQFRLGEIRYGTEVTLQTDVNVGVASVNRTKTDYHNAFLIKGGTKNLSQPTDTGENLQLTERLTLDPTTYPDSTIYTDNAGNIVTREQFVTLGVPALMEELIFDDVYPKLDLYLYNVRERKCWLLDENGHKVEDPNGELDPTDNKRYKAYSKWYTRLAYPIYTVDTQGNRTISSWADYHATQDKIIEGQTLQITFLPNLESGAMTSLLIGQGDFDAVYFAEQTHEWEEDDIDPNGFTAEAGDYRIVQKEVSGLIIPTTSSGGIYPQGGLTPAITNNKSTLLNIVVDDTYKVEARQDLEMVAKRKVSLLRSDLNNYNLPSNPVYFEANNTKLHIGQAVIYNDGQTTPYTLSTHVLKIVTQLDYPFVQEITVGNQKVKGDISTIKEQIQTILSGGVGGGGSIDERQITTLIQTIGSQYFLSKVSNDTAKGEITFKKGIKIGQFRSRFLGSGAAVDPSGNAEFESIYSRSFISTPEFRFNRISVTDGEQWCTNGYGTIESVVEGEDENGDAVVNGGLITLHLEENDYASIAEGDICRGIYNDIADQYHTADMDDDAESAAGSSAQEGDGMGFSSKGGFFTSYFYIERIVKNLRGECQFIYKLRSSTTPHPCAFMKFAQYGSFTNADRRASSYATSIGHYYEMVLEGVKTWQIESPNVVYRKGYLGDMVVELADGTERTLQGYGLYAQNNVYFGSAVIQLDPKTLEMLEDEIAAYDVNISGHVSAIQVDNHGYIIGGIYTDTADGGITTREYRVHSAITVRKNGVLLTEALPSAEAGKGTYKITCSAVDCSYVLDDSTIYLTHIDNLLNLPTDDPSDYDPEVGGLMERCRIDIVVDCEGKTSIQKSIVIAINHDGMDGKGVEYIFITKETWDGTDADKPTIYDVAEDRQVDDYCPYTDAQHTDQWTDEPTGVSDNQRFEFYAQRKQINGIWQPFGEVKLWNRYVVDGVTPYLIDLSNEQSMVACNENGGVVGSYETSRLMLFYGHSYAFTDFAITITPTNISCNGNSSAFTLTSEQKATAQATGYFTLTPSAITADSATIAITATKENVTLSAVYKINKAYAGKNGVIYSLMPSLDTIRKNKNGTLVDSTLTLQVKKTVGATANILTTYSQLQNDGLSLQYQNADGISALSDVSIATSTLIGSGLWGKINLIKSSIIVDSERLNVVVDGNDGAQGKYEEIEYAIGDNRSTAPSSGWSSSQPSPTSSNPYVWRRSRVYNPATGSYSGYTYVCLTGYTGSTGATGPMYYPAGIHDPNKAYSVTAQLVPVVCSRDNNPQYYYAINSVPENRNIPLSNSDYWKPFSMFAAAFIEVLFANFAKLGSFIIWGNLFFSQKGTINGVDSTDYKNSSFQPYLKMDAENGYIYARRGTIGGFEIGDDYIGAQGTSGYTHINKNGYLHVNKANNGEALRVTGTANIYGTLYTQPSSPQDINGTVLNLNANGNPQNVVNIGKASYTQSVNINANAVNFGSSTPVSIGSSLEVQGKFILNGNTTFITNNSSTAKTVALPSNASRGQVVFAKGTVGNLTLTGAIRNDEGDTVTSIGGDRRSRIFIYGDSYWNEFYCS